MKTAQQAAANWQAASGRATTAYSDGVQQYSGDWAGATVAQESVLLQNVTQSITSGQWRQSVINTGTTGWKTATEAKKSNYATGYTAGASKQQTSITKIMSALSTGVAALPPRGDFNANLQRANALATYMHSLKGTLGA